MAFIDQVQDLTSLTVSDNDELTQFLKDGVIDVTNRLLRLDPDSAEGCIRATAEQTANGDYINGATIVSVVREAGTNNDWRECRKVNIGLQSKVADSSSLEYASKFNPAYIIDENGKVNVYPTPGADPNSYIVYYINNVPVNKDLNALSHSDSEIGYFPDNKVYLVVMYAGIKLLQATMASKVSSLPSDLSELSLPVIPVAPTIPTAPTILNSIIGDFGTAPAYTAPTVAGEAEELTASITGGTIGTDADFQDYSDWFEVLGHMIEDEEDSELASMQLQKIATYINAYSQAMQNKLNIFNDANVEYQANMQKKIQQAQLEDSKEGRELQKYSAEINSYQAQVQSQIQEYSANVNGVIQKFGQDLANYNAKMQKHTIDYQWLESQYEKLKAEYDQAFMISSPNSKEGR